MAVDPYTGQLDSEMVPTMNLRWHGYKDGMPQLQQAWAPRYGGRIEWRYVPTVYAHGVPDLHTDQQENPNG